MSHANALARRPDSGARSSRLFKELHAALRGERRDTGRDPSVSGAFRRFAQSARREGISAERVVVALKRAYRAWVRPEPPGDEDRLSRLITLSIESFYTAEDSNEDLR